MEKYLFDSAKVVDITRTRKRQEEEKEKKLTDVDTVVGDMILALSFVVEEARKERKDVKKVKSMLQRVNRTLITLEKRL